MARPKRFTTSYKLLVASVGAASITYANCGDGPVANLVACPPDECPASGGTGGTGGSGGTGGTGGMAGSGGSDECNSGGSGGMAGSGGSGECASGGSGGM